jgi:hypothetical protein
MSPIILGSIDSGSIESSSDGFKEPDSLDREARPKSSSTPRQWSRVVLKETSQLRPFRSLVTNNGIFHYFFLVYAKNAYPSCSGFYMGLFKSELLMNNENWNWANYDTSIYRNWKTGNC